MRKEYRTVSVPVDLVKRAEKYLYQEGYVSIGELVRDLLRRWIQEQEEKRWGK